MELIRMDLDWSGILISLFLLFIYFFKISFGAKKAPYKDEEEEILPPELPIKNTPVQRPKETYKPYKQPTSKSNYSPPLSKSLKAKKPSSLGDDSLKSSLEHSALKSALSERSREMLDHPLANYHVTKSMPSYEHVLNTGVSRAAMMLKKLPRLNHIVVYQEILGKPRALRSHQDHSQE